MALAREILAQRETKKLEMLAERVASQVSEVTKANQRRSWEPLESAFTALLREVQGVISDRRQSREGSQDSLEGMGEEVHQLRLAYESRRRDRASL